jgi:hypothetical protein
MTHVRRLNPISATGPLSLVVPPGIPCHTCLYGSCVLLISRFSGSRSSSQPYHLRKETSRNPRWGRSRRVSGKHFPYRRPTGGLGQNCPPRTRHGRLSSRVHIAAALAETRVATSAGHAPSTLCWTSCRGQTRTDLRQADPDKQTRTPSQPRFSGVGYASGKRSLISIRKRRKGPPRRAALALSRSCLCRSGEVPDARNPFDSLML